VRNAISHLHWLIRLRRAGILQTQFPNHARLSTTRFYLLIVPVSIAKLTA
jgi:hypothetical protein